MSGVQDPGAGQGAAEDPDASGVPDEPPDPPPTFTIGGKVYEFAADFRGDVSAFELTAEEEDYRHRAHAAALHYARDFGLSLIPVWWMKDKVTCACRDGESCGSAGKHPVDLRWPEVATSDPEQAARWWRPLQPGETLPTDWRPQANIGAMMGDRHFITDVDTDAGKQGDESLARLIAEGGGEQMPDTLSYKTGGGGRQYIMLCPPGVEVRNSTSDLADGIDIRGYNGYGILPPSRSAKGEYVMGTDVAPDVPPPGWEADWLREQHRQRTEHIRAHPAGDPRQIPQDGLTRRAHGYVTAAFAGAVAKVAAAEETKRNTTLNAECFDLFSKFVPAGLLSAGDVAAAMQSAAEACGLESDAAGRTIASAWNGGQKKPRDHELPDWLFEPPGEAGGESAGRVLPPSRAPMRVARQIAGEDLATPQGLPSLRWHRGGFARWDGTAWPAEEGKAAEDAVRMQLYEITEHAKVETVDKEGNRRLSPWEPDPRKIADLLEALGVGVLQLPHRLEPPFWITSGAEERGLIPVANGLLDFRTRKLMPHTPDLFNAWSLPYDYDPDALPPAEWLRFLGQLWPDEPDSIAFVQELAGYLISGDTSQEKITLMTGAMRGGKGTVCKVLTALLGEQNVASPTFASLTAQFGLAPLIGKPLAIISDARIGGRDIQAAVEKLLTISGRDRLPVDRKYKSIWEGQLPTRLIIVSNELPALRDASTALASRCIPLNFTKSWLNREDTGLGARLTTPRELSRILPWALNGMDRLHKQGKFTMPAGAAETLAALERLASPEKSWAQEHCEFGPGLWERTEYLHGAFELWASNEQRMKNIPNREMFAKNLHAAFPELVHTRPRSVEDGKQYPGYRGIRLLRS